MIATTNNQSTLACLHALADELRPSLFGILDASTVKREPFEMAIGWNESRWGPMGDEGQPHAKTARTLFSRWQALALQAIRVGAPERESSFTEHNGTISRVIEQTNDWYGIGAYQGGIEEVRRDVTDSLDAQTAVLNGLPTAHGPGEALLVADTSAFLDRPDLQAWALGGKSWTVVVLPQVLSELDDKKRDPRTREAATKVIRQMTDLGRRGDTLAGVQLSGKLRYREIATSPDMDTTVPWLRRDVPDDQIVAGALDLACQDLTGTVCLLASDRNLHNKARVAGLGYAGVDVL